MSGAGPPVQNDRAVISRTKAERAGCAGCSTRGAGGAFKTHDRLVRAFRPRLGELR